MSHPGGRHDASEYEIGKDMQRIFHILEHIMATLADVQAELAIVKQKVVDDNTQDQATITDLRAQIAALQAIIDAGSGATPEQLQGIVDSLKDIESNVQANV